MSIGKDEFDVLGANLSPIGAHIKVGHSNLSNKFNNPPLTQREVCYALGGILLEIFSQGDSFDFQLLMMDLGLFDLSRVSPLEDTNLNSESTSPQQTPKKSLSTTNLISTTEFIKAKTFLEERGLPWSICQIVSDLLQVEEGNPFVTSTAFLSLEDAQFDLLQMRMHPTRFLHDNTCPQTELELMSLFGQSNKQLYGRDKEMNILMERAVGVYSHTSPQSGIVTNLGPHQPWENNFLGEVILLAVGRHNY